MTDNRFCPECSTILRPTELENKEEKVTKMGLYLICRECGFQKKTESFSTYHFSKNKERTNCVNDKRIVNDYIYDMTLPRTKSIECSNSACLSKGKDNPEIVIITSNEHPEIAYLCTVCKNTWGRL